MYGAFSGMSFGLVIVAVLVVVALAVAASPLFAVIIAAVIAVFFLVGMSAQRRRSEGRGEPGADTPAAGPSPSTQGRARGTTGTKSSGEPVSGEG